jgi:endoglucanase
VPDLLDEVRWNVDWMLSMQDEDGGVWHKQTSLTFPAMIMPEDDRQPSYVIGAGAAPFKSACATADFAAVLAIAARVYRPFDREYAARCARAAERAWRWLAGAADVPFENPPGVTTGGYGDRNCGDERLWAASELWRATGRDEYLMYFLAHYGPWLGALKPDGPPGWPNVAPLALWGYALGRGARPDAAASAVRRASTAAADEIVRRTRGGGYRVSLMTKDYAWGSNGVAANYGVQLLVADALRRDRRYVDAALDNLHYLLGRNTFSLSWVTRLGANPYRRPHHRPSAADANEEPWPGLLSGGPNRSRQDDAMRTLPDLPPSKT